MIDDLLVALLGIAGGVSSWTLRWVLWQQDGLTYIDFRSIIVTPADLLITVALCIEAGRWLLSTQHRHEGREALRRLWQRGGWAYALFVLWMALSTAWSTVPLLALYEAARWGLLGGFAVLVCQLRDRSAAMVLIMLALATGQSIIALMQVWQGGSIGLAALGEMAFTYGRGHGLAVNPNNLAGHLVAVMWLAGALIVQRWPQERQLDRAVWLGMMGVVFIGLVATFSRAALLGAWAGIGVVVLASRLPRRWIRGWLLLTVVVGVSVGARGLELEAIFQRLSQDSELTLYVWSERPMIGQGANQLMLHVDQIMIPDIPDRYRMPAHNAYLVIGAELGGVGLLTFAGWWCLGVWRAWRARSVLLGGMIALSLIMAFDYYYVRDVRSQVWLVWLWGASVCWFAPDGVAPAAKPNNNGVTR